MGRVESERRLRRVRGSMNGRELSAWRLRWLEYMEEMKVGNKCILETVNMVRKWGVAGIGRRQC